MRTRHLTLMVALTVLPLGCTVGPKFTRPTPSVPAQWSSSSTAPAAQATSTVNNGTADLSTWWAEFNDPGLSSLIERSRASNLDLRAAVLRISESRAELDEIGRAHV